MTRLLTVAVVLCATARLAHADCPEGTPQAACVLHEEGVALLTSSRYEEAATKFRSAIAASPSSRSYLGYSQAVEGQGKVALAYETMLVAQRLSNDEMAASGGNDPALVGRAERIKYKLGDLGGKVGFVWLRVPEGVAPQRLVSVHREHEGDLPSPLGRWVTVAPDRQLLVAALDDGSQLQVVAKVAAGSQSSLVIPIPAPRQVQQPPPPRTRPLTALYEKPPPMPPKPMPAQVLSFGLSVLAPGPELGNVTMASAAGIYALYERKVGRSVGLTTRFDYVAHPSNTIDFDTSTSGTEALMLVGLRSMTRTFHARVEGGVTISTVELDVDGPAGRASASTTDVYPVIGFGGGLQFGRMRIHGSILYAANTSTDAPTIPVRFMGVIGFDLWRK